MPHPDDDLRYPGRYGICPYVRITDYGKRKTYICIACQLL